MARIRTVKPEFWNHPKVVRVCRDARLLFLGLLNESDDQGKLRWSSKRLAGVLFSEDEDMDAAEIDRLAGELERVGLVMRYEVDDAPLCIIPGFTEHQRVSHPSPSRLPDPHEPSDHPPETFANLSRDAPESQEILPGGNREQGTGNREGNMMALTRRDVLFEAVADVCGIDWHVLTGSQRGWLNKAVSELRGVEATPEQVSARATVYRAVYPDAALTPSALAKHWSSLNSSEVVPGGKGAILRAVGRAQE